MCNTSIVAEHVSKHARISRSHNTRAPLISAKLRLPPGTSAPVRAAAKSSAATPPLRFSSSRIRSWGMKGCQVSIRSMWWRQIWFINISISDDSGQSIPDRFWSLWSSNLSAIICAASPGGQRITGRTRIVATIESRPSTMRSMYLSLLVSKRFGQHSVCKLDS